MFCRVPAKPYPLNRLLQLSTALSLAFLPAAQGQQTGPLELDDIEVRSHHESLGEAPPARAGGQVATGARMGILGNAEVMDTPFSVTSYTDKTIEDRHAQSMVDLLAADPSVRQSGPRTHVTELLRIRGYLVGNGAYALGGMFGLNSQLRTYLEPFERVEVIKGPSAALFGMAPNGSIGGVINLLPKRAKAQPIHKITLMAAQDSTAGVHLDVGRRFAGDAVGVRINLMQREGDTALDYQTARRKLASLALDLRVGKLSASLDVIHSLDDVNNITRSFNIPSSLSKLPKAPDGKNTYAGGGDYETLDRTWVARLEYALTEHLTAYLGYGGHRVRTDGILIYPGFINSAGDYSYAIRQWKQDVDNRSIQAGLRGFAHTGPVSHQFALDWSAMDRNDATVGPNWGGGTLNIYLPKSQRRIARPPRAKVSTVPNTSTELESVALADTLGFFSDQLLFSVGIRRQQVFSKAHSTGIKYNKNADTPFVGILYKVAPFASLYASYVEGLQQGGRAPDNNPAYSNPGEQLPPYVAKQKEVGIKLDFDEWIATAALYELTRPLAGDRFITATAPIDRIYTIVGEERSRGLELAGSGQVLPEVRILGGVTFSKARIEKSPDPNMKGKKIAGIAPFQANLGTEWDTPFLSGLILTLNGLYTDRVPSRNDNGLYAPSWKTLDGGFRYRMGESEDKSPLLRFNLHNLTNERYWGGTGSYLGAPRTWSLSLSMEI